MSYPNTSNWNSNVPGSAWWIVTQADGSRQVCETTAYAFIRFAQKAFRDALPDVGASVWDGTPIRKSQFAIDTQWGKQTAGAAWWLGTSLGAPADVLQAIRGDGNRFLTVDAIRAAIWILAKLSGRPIVSMASIAIPDDAKPTVASGVPPRPLNYADGTLASCHPLPSLTTENIPVIDVMVEPPVRELSPHASKSRPGWVYVAGGLAVAAVLTAAVYYGTQSTPRRSRG